MTASLTQTVAHVLTAADRPLTVDEIRVQVAQLLPATATPDAAALRSTFVNLPLGKELFLALCHRPDVLAVRLGWVFRDGLKLVRQRRIARHREEVLAVQDDGGGAKEAQAGGILVIPHLDQIDLGRQTLQLNSMIEMYHTYLLPDL